MKPITALLVMSGERRAAVLERLEGCGVHVLVACGLKEARGILDTRAVDLIFTEAAVAGGDWRDILAYKAEAGLHSEVIVCVKRLERGLCVEAYTRGAWDMLADTCSLEEMRKTIESAVSHSYMHSLAPRRRTARAEGVA